MPKIPMPPKEYYRLFIDESGTANPLDIFSDIYILSGCSLKKSDCTNLKIFADQIKFKYWNKTDIVFHSRELGRREGDFSIFKDDELFKHFLVDLENFLSSPQFKMFFIVVDKAKARIAGWDEKKVYKDTASFLVRNFLLRLLTTDSRGEMIIESATAEKDIYLLQALGYFLASGLDKPKVSYDIVQDTLTSVSFVTKQNNDIEEQISDLFGYAAKLTYLKDFKQTASNSYENMILRVFQRNIYKVPIGAGPKKAKFLNEVKPFLILP